MRKESAHALERGKEKEEARERERGRERERTGGESMAPPQL
jgi:hypothetical protein